MHLHCIGLNHKTTSLSVRESFTYNDAEIKAALSRFGCGKSGVSEEISEVVILSTCNRVEIYAIAPSDAAQDLEKFLLEKSRSSIEEIKNYMYHLRDDAAIDHLFRVAAGLDSLVIGESQILGQVMHALELARGQNSSGRILSRLFEFALHVGKRVRTETAIGQNPTSVAAVAIHLASQTIENIASAKLLIIGAGEMAEMALAALRKRGVHQIRVVNRTMKHAQQLAEKYGGQAEPFEGLTDCLVWSELVIASTGAPHTIIQASLLRQVMDKRNGRSIVLIDIAVPRDIDAHASSIPGVRLYDLDVLEESVGVSMELRSRQIPNAEIILRECKIEFQEYLQLLDVFPLIAAMHQRAETIRRLELEKTMGRLPDLDETQRKQLSILTKALVKKILSAPTRQLRSAAGSSQAAEYASVARVLFDLDDHHLSA